MIDDAVGNPQCKFKFRFKHQETSTTEIIRGTRDTFNRKRESAASIGWTKRGNNSPMKQRILHNLDIISVKRICSQGQWFKIFITNTTSFEI